MRWWIVLVAAMLACGPVLSDLAPAGEPGFVLKSRPKVGDTGDTIDLPIRLDVGPEPIYAWSVAVCHDPEVLSIDEVVNGILLDTINEGDVPDFDDITLYDDGFVTGVIICLTSCDSLAVGDNYEIHTVTYSLDGLAPVDTDIEFCNDRLGVVDNEVVIEGGQSVTPETIDTTISIVGPIPLWFTLSMPDVSRFYDVGDGLVSFDQPVSLVEHDDDPTYPNAIEAMTLSISHDPAVLEATDVAVGADLALVNDGLGPDFFDVDYLAGATVVGVIVTSEPSEGLVAEDDVEIAVVTYDGVTSFLTGFPFGLTTPLSFESDDETVDENDITSGDYLVGFEYEGADVKLEPRELFLRGDVDDDGDVDFLDATDLLDRLFGEGDAVACRSAADLNEDLLLNLVDPIYLLAFVFLDGDAPPAPYPSCAFDDADESSCGDYASCP